MLTKILGAAVLALIALNVTQYLSRRDLAADLAVMTADRDGWKNAHAAEKANAAAAESANQSNQDTIATLRGNLAKALELEAAATARGERALRDLREARQTIAEASRREAASRATIYATDPTCAAWAAAPVCGAIADRLRLAAGQGAAPGT